MKKDTLKRMTLCGALIGFPLGLMAQDDPFAVGKEKAKEAEKPSTIKIVYEVFSLPIKQAAAIQRSGISDSAFYAKMLIGLKDKTVKQESFLVARTSPGQLVKVEQIHQYIYPTEFEPAELPNAVANTGKSEDGEGKKEMIFPVTPAHPTAFDTRNIGETLEVEAQRDQGGAIALRIAPSRVSLIQRDTTGQGVSKLEQPRFSNPRLSTGIVTRSGKPAYLGTVSDPVELQPKDGGQHVFFAFVTATNVSQ